LKFNLVLDPKPELSLVIDLMFDVYNSIMDIDPVKIDFDGFP